MTPTRQEALEAAHGLDGQKGHSARACAYCGAVLDGGGRGKPQKFCKGRDCRRLFWQEARRVGGKVLRRRRSRQMKPRSLARRAGLSGRHIGVLIALGAMPLFLLGRGLRQDQCDGGAKRAGQT